jgi:alpha-glucosidase (family GH31 glycosyl hydrolase)
VSTATVVKTGDPIAASGRMPNGNPILPPKWAFGVLWGSYYDQIGSESAKGGNLMTAADWLRCSTYGGDLLWIDSSWLYHDYTSSASGQYYICFQADTATFPDFSKMIQYVQSQHFHFGVWQWPWMGHGCQYYAAGVANQYFVMVNSTTEALASAMTTGGNIGAPWHGDTKPAEFDFTNPATVTWWKGLNGPLSNAGLDMLKLDATQVQQGLPVLPANGGHFMNGTVDDYTKAYHQAGFDVTAQYSETNNAEAKQNGGRGFILVHGDPGAGRQFGTPGNDQTPGMWTGDTIADWRGLDCNGCTPDGGVTELVQGNSDIERAHKMNTPTTTAYWGGDTGGYDTVPVDEVYQRWLEYSTFTPLQEFFGAKSTGIGARFPWLFGQKSQLYALEYNKLRYMMLPFRYSNAQATYHIASAQMTGAAAGAPPVHYPVTWSTNGNFMVLAGDGDTQVLVQPITGPGVTTATIPLPDGKWILYWTGQVFNGGASSSGGGGTPEAGTGATEAGGGGETGAGSPEAGADATTNAGGGDDGGAPSAAGVSVPAPPDQIPVLVKAGSIIPFGPVMQYVDQFPADPLTLDIYPSGATSYTLYEDDGISRGYMGGAFATTKFSVDDTSGHITVTIGAQSAQHQFAGQLKDRTYILKINTATTPTTVTQDGTALPEIMADPAADASAAVSFAAATQGWYLNMSPTTVVGTMQAPAVYVKFHLDSSKSTTVTLQ